MIEFLVGSGLVCDIALAVLALETVGGLVLRKRLRFGPQPLDIMMNAAAGAGLILALRAALVDAGALAVVAGLTVALVAHVGETILRWRGGSRSGV